MHRRALLSGLAGSLITAPALAQFNLGNLIQGGANIVGAMTASEGDEVKLGETYYQQYLQKSGGIHPDRNAQEALKRFAQPLINAADRRQLPWEITLVSNKQVNAWALPGGKLAINSALVQYSQSPDELASVIAHEIGHADRGHGLAQMKNQNLMTGLGAIGKEALATFGGAAGALTAQVLGALEGPLYTLVLTGYSRTNEFEADAHILQIFERTGYDPTKADDFFRTLLKLHPEGSETTSLFSTHPGTTERITKIEEAAAKMSRPSRAAAAPGWAELKALFPTPAG
ncbi:Peptidase M48, Ste24p [Magnetospirillum sp. LM-5]|uniref:M48 family metalloprotease n=1 Tax=Magnetospirillum sp. LM-5 TaxID=2681466 RepID=UPI001382C772|nr:M48 family metalloprotease [Magnetospirillum sp. LM-5]CAA7611312.1 Peptidase M48, Ste24p [Magnetospirillum sp. LM-5]